MGILHALVAATCALAPACAAPEVAAPAAPPAGELAGATVAGEHWVRVRTDPEPIPLNEPFALEVEVRDARQRERPVAGAQVFVRAWMPAHGHGMNRKPRVVPTGDGRFDVQGMLFHMSGHWEIGIDVLRGGVASTAIFEVDLP